MILQVDKWLVFIILLSPVFAMCESNNSTKKIDENKREILCSFVKAIKRKNEKLFYDVCSKGQLVKSLGHENLEDRSNKIHTLYFTEYSAWKIIKDQLSIDHPFNCSRYSIIQISENNFELIINDSDTLDIVFCNTLESLKICEAVPRTPFWLLSSN